jgi:Cd2+/Zn2+-exporting ATPase
MSENHNLNSAFPIKIESSTKVPSNTLVLHIEKMDCPTEESLIRQKLEGIKGIESLEFNLIQRKLTVRHHLQDPESIINALVSLDMEPVVENVPKLPSGSSQAIFIINNMDCPTEEALIRNKLSTMNGVIELDFNLMQRKLTVTHTLGKSDAIQQALIDIDMHAVPLVATAIRAQSESKPTPNAQKKWWLLGLGGIAAILAEVIAWTGGSEKSWPVIMLAIFSIVSIASTYKKAGLL